MHRCLRDDGLTLLHCIGGNTSVNHIDPWIEKYIFPKSMIPTAAQFAAASERRFVIEDWHGFGPYYDHALMARRSNFDAARPELAESYEDHFRRKWRLYLCASAASFRARRNQFRQLVLSPKGVPGGYDALR